MGLAETLRASAVEALPFLIVGPLMLVPFIIAEQIRPVHRRPGWRDYLTNILISATTLYLAMPAGVLIGFASERLRGVLPWKPIAVTYSDLATIPVVGGALEIVAMILVPLLLHDCWFYWAHRIEHKVPALWEFHKLHHSDELMNSSTWGRDHFAQAIWIALFPTLTVGLVIDLSARDAAQATLLSMLVLSLQSMFYHSAIKVRLPWLDRIVVTPQVHRIHHSIDPAHHNANFADAFPLFDIVFGTYRRPGPDEFPETGLGPSDPAPRSLWQAQAEPAWRGVGRLVRSAPADKL